MEIEIEKLCEIIGCDQEHIKREDIGDRIWLAKGKKANVIYFDSGNGWCRILYVDPKNVSLEEILKQIYSSL